MDEKRRTIILSCISIVALIIFFGGFIYYASDYIVSNLPATAVGVKVTDKMQHADGHTMAFDIEGKKEFFNVSPFLYKEFDVGDKVVIWPEEGTAISTSLSYALADKEEELQKKAVAKANKSKKKP